MSFHLNGAILHLVDVNVFDPDARAEIAGLDIDGRIRRTGHRGTKQ